MGIIIKQLVTLAIGTCEGFRRTYETSSNSSGINEAERDLTVLCTTERGAVRGDSETHVYTAPVASVFLKRAHFCQNGCFVHIHDQGMEQMDILNRKPESVTLSSP